MKSTVLFLIALALLICVKATPENSKKVPDTENEPLHIFCSQQVRHVSHTLVNQFSSQNPSSNISVHQINNLQNPNLLVKSGLLILHSSDQLSFDKSSDLLKVTIARNVIVPVVSKQNLYFTQISQHGVSMASLKKLLTNPEQTWEQFIGAKSKAPINVYVQNNEFVQAQIANLLSDDAQMEQNAKIQHCNDILTALAKDPFAIGFCLLNDIINYEKHSFKEGVALLPIDLNENGRIDYIENIYSDLNTFNRGVWIKKYPEVFVNEVYFLSSKNIENNISHDFMKWTVSQGQTAVGAYNLTELTQTEQSRNMDKLYLAYTTPSAKETIVPNKVYEKYVNTKNTFYRIAAFLVIAFVFAVFLEIGIHKLRVRRAQINSTKSYGFSNIFNEDTITVAKGLFYDKSHTWAFMEQSGMVRIGVDDFIPHVTGAITKVVMKQRGEKVKKGENLLEIIHKGKKLFVKAPVSGTIKEHNEALVANAEKINDSPYSEGWVYMIEPNNWLREIPFLISGNNYKEWIRNEFNRLKDFLASVMNVHNAEYAYALQDGGEIKEGILADFAPEVWEDFQTSFIDKA